MIPALKSICGHPINEQNSSSQPTAAGNNAPPEQVQEVVGTTTTATVVFNGTTVEIPSHDATNAEIRLLAKTEGSGSAGLKNNQHKQASMV